MRPPVDAVVNVSPRGIRAGAENHTAVARPASPKSNGYGTRPMLLSSVVEVHGPASTRSPRVTAARAATGSSGAVSRKRTGPTGDGGAP